MKRIILIFQLLLLFVVGASGTIESWSTFGGEYTHLVGEQENAQFDGLIQDEYGAYLGYAGFPCEKSLGLYLRGIIQVPIKGEMRFGEDFPDFIHEVGNTESETKILGRMMAGPIYRKKVGSIYDLYFAIGPELRLFEMISTNSSGSEYLYLYYLGIGLDLGYKHNLSNFLFMQIGINADYKARAHTGADIIISPYLGFGFQY